MSVLRSSLGPIRPDLLDKVSVESVVAVDGCLPAYKVPKMHPSLKGEENMQKEESVGQKQKSVGL